MFPKYDSGKRFNLQAALNTRGTSRSLSCATDPVFSEAIESKDVERYKNYAEIKAEIDNSGGPIVSNYR